MAFDKARKRIKEEKEGFNRAMSRLKDGAPVKKPKLEESADELIDQDFDGEQDVVVPPNQTEDKEGDDRDLILDENVVIPYRSLCEDLSGNYLPTESYQNDAMKFLFNKCFPNGANDPTESDGCILAHTMGAGKTRTVLLFLESLLKSGLLKKVLIVMPKVMLSNWEAEIKKWIRVSLNIIVFDTLPIIERKHVVDQWRKLKTHSIILIGYEMLYNVCSKSKDIQECILAADILVFDEAHRLKNEKSHLAVLIKSCEVACRRRILMTGTPMPNKLSDLFNLVDFASPGSLGNLKQFRKDFTHIQQAYGTEVSEDDIHSKNIAVCKLQKLVKNCFHRVGPEITQKALPPNSEYVVHLMLTDVQSMLLCNYTQVTHDKELEANHVMSRIVNHPNVVLLHKEQKEQTDSVQVDISWYEQIISGNYDIGETDVTHSVKLVLILKLLQLCENSGDKMVIFSSSVDALRYIEKVLRARSNTWAAEGGKEEYKWKPQSDYIYVDGQTSDSRRPKMICDFNNIENKRLRLLLITKQVGGEGLNMFAANRLIILEPDWRPSIDAQAVGRIVRKGQQKPTYVYRFVTKGTKLI